MVYGFDGLKVVPFGSDLLAPVAEITKAGHATVPQLRSLLGASDWGARHEAGQALIQSGDVPSILRLVYALKQGYSEAERILLDHATIQVVPYLLEEVAHGSLQRSPDYSLDACGRVRGAATEIMLRALEGTADLPEDTKGWLRGLSGGLPFFYVPEKSQALLEWWVHNQVALSAGKLHEAVWLPRERKIVPKVFQDWRKMNQAKPPPPPPPAPPPLPPVSDPPLQVEESFEVWSARIVRPELRDLTYASVDFETGKSVLPVRRPKGQVPALE